MQYKTKNVYTDHLGNKYYSFTAMCQAYGLNPQTCYGRKKRGWSLEKILTTKTNTDDKKIVDHYGNTYKTVKEMCEAYEIDYLTYFSRKRAGLPLKEILEKKRHGNFEVVDHLGNTYTTTKEMCKAHGVEYMTYYSRRQSGFSIKEALDPNRKIPRPYKKRKPIKNVKDHLGNRYPNIAAMCRAYNIAESTYKKRIERGMSVKDALTAVTKRDNLKDVVVSNPLYYYRKKKGWSEEDARHKKAKNRSKTCKDHNGKNFSSIQEMCRAHGIAYRTFKERMNHGWTLKDALTTDKVDKKNIAKEKYVGMQKLNLEGDTIKITRYENCRDIDVLVNNKILIENCHLQYFIHGTVYKDGIRHTNEKKIKDHEGREFDSINKMCKHYNINTSTFYSRRKAGWDIKDSLLGRNTN